MTLNVVIAGGGPAGATAATYLARAGHRVTVLEKTRYPREKVCGDGLTPRAVREMNYLGMAHDEADGWQRTRGLRFVAGGCASTVSFEGFSSDIPSYGLTRTRADFDQQLARMAAAAGAEVLESHTVRGAVRDDAGRVVGVTVQRTTPEGRRDGEPFTVAADVVVAADGNSSPVAKSLGILPRSDRPMGVAQRVYYTSPMSYSPWMETWLQLPDRNGDLMPGYGWVFGVGDGTANVGLGILDTAKDFRSIDLRSTLSEWVEVMQEHEPTRGFVPENQVGVVRGAALPMAFNRTPHVVPGAVLLGDAAGLVSPFNGEGIDAAMESARIAADVIDDAVIAARYRGGTPAQVRAAFDAGLQRYPELIQQHFGAHYGAGKVFAHMVGNPKIMRTAVRLGMGSNALMRFVVRAMGNLSDRNSPALVDRVVQALERVVPPVRNIVSTPGRNSGKHSAKFSPEEVRLKVS